MRRDEVGGEIERGEMGDSERNSRTSPADVTEICGT